MFLWRPSEPDERGVDEAYVGLRDRIVNGSYGPGTLLRVGDVAGTLGVGKGSVREAMRRLTRSGLLRGGLGEATVVTEADLDRTRDAQLVVAEMHRLAVTLATPRLTRGDLAQLRAANDRFAAAIHANDVDEALAADDEFHAIPVLTSGNHTLAEVLEQYMPMLRRLERLQFGSFTGPESIARHERLLDCFAAGRAEAAAAVSDEIWQSLRLLAGPDGMAPGGDPPGAVTHPGP